MAVAKQMIETPMPFMAHRPHRLYGEPVEMEEMAEKIDYVKCCHRCNHLGINISVVLFFYGIFDRKYHAIGAFLVER